MNDTKHYRARIVRKENLSKRVYELLLDMEDPREITFIASQFITVDVGNEKNRLYSISSSPFLKDQLELLVDVAPGGPGSKYFESVKPGDTITFREPRGRFNLAKETGTIVFLSSGTGVAPFKSMISYLTEKQDNEQKKRASMYLFQSFRYEKDIFLRYYFESLDTRYDNFHFVLTLSQPSSEWTGCSGYVQTCIPQPVLTDPKAHFYICGGPMMVEGTRSFLREQHIPEDHIHFEPF